jgi:hypothetical protein
MLAKTGIESLQLQLPWIVAYNFERVEALIARLRNLSTLVPMHVNIEISESVIDHMRAYFTRLATSKSTSWAPSQSTNLPKAFRFS